MNDNDEDHRAAIRIDLFAEGLSHPTSMAFADNATLLDFLILE